MHIKYFDEWNNVKKKLHYSKHNPPLFKERDIWWVSVGTNIGFEEDGKNENFVRPVLVLKKFSRELFLGLPMSTKLKSNKYYFPIKTKDRTVSVLISQLRVFSYKRIWNKIVEVDIREFERIQYYLSGIFNLPPSPKRGSRGNCQFN